MPGSRERLDLRALLETSRLLTSSLEIGFVLGSLLLTAMSKLLVPRGLILLDDPLSGGFRVEAMKGRFPESLARGTVIQLPRPATLLQEDGVPAPLLDNGIKLLLPITYHERLIGLLALGGKATGEAFTEDEKAFLDALVHLSATAVHNAAVVEELQQANRELGQKVQQLNALFDVAQGFTAAPSVDRAARLLALTLMGHFMVHRFAVLLRSDEAGAELELAAGRAVDGLGASTMAHLSGMKRLALLDDDAPPELVPLREAGFALALPLRMQEATRGILLLGPKSSGEEYHAEDVDFLIALGQLALTAIESARGVEARLENQRLEEELRLARDIQERLLPRELPEARGVDLAALNLPSRFVAGDYYDALELDDGRLLVAVADVSGKGLPASLLMANLQACFHLMAASLGAGTVDLPTATARVNRVIHRNTSITTFITFFWGIYDPRESTFRFVNAGHNPPIVLRGDGGIERLEEGGVLLGVLADAPYEEGEVVLDGDAAAVLFTDGVTEAWSATDPDDEFGEERLIETLKSGPRDSADALLKAVRQAVRSHVADGPLDDDLTIIVLVRNETTTEN